MTTYIHSKFSDASAYAAAIKPVLRAAFDQVHNADYRGKLNAGKDLFERNAQAALDKVPARIKDNAPYIAAAALIIAAVAYLVSKIQSIYNREVLRKFIETSQSKADNLNPQKLQDPDLKRGVEYNAKLMLMHHLQFIGDGELALCLDSQFIEMPEDFKNTVHLSVITALNANSNITRVELRNNGFNQAQIDTLTEAGQSPVYGRDVEFVL